MQAVSSLSELNLHDSEVLGISVDRHADTIRVDLLYVEDYDTGASRPRSLVFSRCFKAVLDLNLVVAPPESILGGAEVSPSTLVEELRSRWSRAGTEISPPPRHYRLEMNTSGGMIDIVAGRVEISP